MYNYSFLPTFNDVTVLISFFALAWFLVGIVLGLRLSQAKSRTGHSSTPKKLSAKRQIEIYVGNLPYDIREKDLAKTFKSFGEVFSTRIIKNKINGKSKGYGFVQMTDKSESAEAISEMNGTMLKGRRIVVSEARSQEQ